MSNWLLALIFGVFIAISVGCSTATADDIQPAATRVYGMTPGRLWATIDAVVGLVGAILAGRALARSASRIGNGGRNGAIVAMVVGLIVIAYAVLHLILFTGDFGTGGGGAGAIIAIVMGLTSMGLAGLALTRSRRKVG